MEFFSEVSFYTIIIAGGHDDRILNFGLKYTEFYFSVCYPILLLYIYEKSKKINKLKIRVELSSHQMESGGCGGVNLQNTPRVLLPGSNVQICVNWSLCRVSVLPSKEFKVISR